MVRVRVRVTVRVRVRVRVVGNRVAVGTGNEMGLEASLAVHRNI
tara:strand:- start:536 stop:667 length:132 start_codon:yes stop_codon:yes gene_type:complete